MSKPLSAEKLAEIRERAERGADPRTIGFLLAKGPLAERLEYWSTPEPNTGCILWAATVDPGGYGQISVRGRGCLAHRVAWELERGPIPPGLELDHLCRVHSCINVQHMELVPHRENVLRGVGPSARNARSQTCIRGHQYQPAGGRRWCSKCHTILQRLRNNAKRSNAL